MCQTPDPGLDALVMQAAAATGATVLSLPRATAKAGSRRRRLWELDAHAHCPVIGVCLPLPALRRIVDKVLSGEALANDYELHCGVIAECRRRTPIAEALQRELDRRCMIALRQAALAKTTEGLAAWWQAASAGQDLAGAFWATLTHPRCTPELEHRVLGDVHMLQHQVGVARRVDLKQFEEVLHENGVLARELAAAQQRNTRQADEHRQRHDAQQSHIVQLRAQLIGRDTLIASLRHDLQSLEDAVPGLKTRQALGQENERLLRRLHDTERTLMQAQHELERARARADELTLALQRLPQPEAPTAAPAQHDPTALADRAVLCVGGRPASVPVYRHLVERTGGRFLHHDGGDEDNPAQLDATLAAADLVICQTGCISHDAYWRVKDHCKRTGKRCVFVETPSTAGLKRALRSLVPVVESPPA
ncbi:DUF2325 domain-containing protein [Piscinibacter gummiphilus]|uniref:DUF2325 domain-containing protein n=1 Tax=Piscinibacter gummiphilus TaxID=946333 RepID=A0ABZ0CW31_9BURK|nr:DUF2325 domain-containing protein [Piscinibacter gummiphilus]WOB09184.1 DUF2325 domain-containing protein [Piscinibacter gummiphilus]